MSDAGKILLLAIGNPARGDDGLGPALADRFEQLSIPGVTAMWNYQPSVENAADLAEHDTVIFVDASFSGPSPFSFQRLLGRATGSLSSHNLPPEAVVDLACQTLGWRGRAYLLAIRGETFEPFVESLSDRARSNLQMAIHQLSACIASGTLESLVTDAPTHSSDRHGASWLNANT
ncbi:MAG: hydrogenase maturation protease [Phycisphaerales bacterium]